MRWPRRRYAVISYATPEGRILKTFYSRFSAEECAAEFNVIFHEVKKRDYEVVEI